MARTRASVGAKISSGKSNKARCAAAPPTTVSTTGAGSSEKAARSAGGGNPVCPRETPAWQRPISAFFISKGQGKEDGAAEHPVAAGSSKSKPKRNVIESDDETSPEKTKNSELDDSIELQTLSGENSHKIEEYYPGDKGKGVGKKTSKGVGKKTRGLGKKTKRGVESSESEGEGKIEGEGKSEKENFNNNIDDSNSSSITTNKSESEIEKDCGSTIKGSKRGRGEDIIEDSVSKKRKID